jgi:hypothetical protein
MTMFLIIFNRGGLDSDNVPNGSNLIENLRPHDKEVTKGELVLFGSEKNAKDHQTSRSAIYTLVIIFFHLILHFTVCLCGKVP